jgi:hypothetical protein
MGCDRFGIVYTHCSIAAKSLSWAKVLTLLSCSLQLVVSFDAMEFFFVIFISISSITSLICQTMEKSIPK